MANLLHSFSRYTVPIRALTLVLNNRAPAHRWDQGVRAGADRRQGDPVPPGLSRAIADFDGDQRP